MQHRMPAPDHIELSERGGGRRNRIVGRGHQDDAASGDHFTPRRWFNGNREVAHGAGRPDQQRDRRTTRGEGEPDPGPYPAPSHNRD